VLIEAARLHQCRGQERTTAGGVIDDGHVAQVQDSFHSIQKNRVAAICFITPGQ